MNICDKQKMHLLSSNLVNTKLHENSSLSASLLSCRLEHADKFFYAEHFVTKLFVPKGNFQREFCRAIRTGSDECNCN